MNTYKYLGNTLESLAFRFTDENGNYTDFGVFNFPAIIDEEGHEIEPAKPYFSTFFAKYVETGEFIDDGTFKDNCYLYLVTIGFLIP